MLMTANKTLQTPPTLGKNEMMTMRSKKKDEKFIAAA
jgi:hypothetical protein